MFCALFLATGCEDEFKDLNTNNNEPERASPNVVLTAALEDQMNDFGGTGLGYIGVFNQHFSGNHATGVDYDQYVLTNNSFAGQFTNSYLGHLKDYQYLIREGADLGAMHYAGVAKIMTALSLGVMTDMYGSIPWSEALDAANFSVGYDDQESIYNTIQVLLSEGIADLGGTSNLALSLGDFVFNGDTDKWIATAHLLRARYFNHLSKRDPMGSATSALTAVDAAKAAGLTSSSGDLVHPWEGTAQHRNRWNLLYENNLIIASENFMDYLVTNNDPRLEAYWDDQAFGSPPVNVGYLGKPQGFGTDNTSYSPVGPAGYFGQTDSDQFLATYFELLFIEAEAAMRSGDAPRAATALNDAVRAQVNQVVSHANGLANTAAYFGTYASYTAGTVTMEAIMTEKWKAMFTMELESWTDVRRHDYAYPNWLEIPADGTSGPVATEFIRRILYPQAELDLNTDNVPPNVTIFQRLWWDQ